MVITPTVDSTGARAYVSGPVTTTLRGKLYTVSAGYEGSSVVEVVRQAFGNAQVVHMKARLAERFSVR
jgi:hypothetical protein